MNLREKQQILKSDLVENKKNIYKIVRAGDGNIRFSDPVFSKANTNFDKPSIIRVISLKILSGGLKDTAVISFQPALPAEIHTFRPPEVSNPDSVVFKFQGGNCEALYYLRQHSLKTTLPRISSGETLTFVLLSSQKILLFLNNKFLVETYFDMNSSTAQTGKLFMNVFLSGYLTEVELSEGLPPELVSNSLDSLLSQSLSDNLSDTLKRLNKEAKRNCGRAITGLQVDYLTKEVAKKIDLYDSKRVKQKPSKSRPFYGSKPSKDSKTNHISNNPSKKPSEKERGILGKDSSVLEADSIQIEERGEKENEAENSVKNEEKKRPLGPKAVGKVGRGGCGPCRLI